ncbi:MULTISPECIES: tetratricopeptide repeat protein [Rhizobium]|uniref:tetratricopeptide repeat protein n=1 Tax=Rhizobium phaseoli TaxID=396 RepID=UPI00068FD5AC|nr:hypothetical protein [Rhizobium phaseoli]ANL33705.1 tetratricopeptide repeat-containing protein [Rhizobium phaseoli]ANL97432.1 tetratricopeptide repeat-containing protein [Rhizobium phaseoli]
MGRRLTTILSADVAGFSHLMGADEERTLGAFRVCRDTIGRLLENHGGRRRRHRRVRPCCRGGAGIRPKPHQLTACVSPYRKRPNQDEVIGKIVEALVGQLVELPPRKRPKSLEAYDICVRGRSLISSFTSFPEAIREAQILLERAILIEPEYSEASRWLAFVHRQLWAHSIEPSDENRSRALELARRAVQLDGSDAAARWVLGYLLAYEKSWPASDTEFEAAFRLEPNNTDALVMSSELAVYAGQPLEAIDTISRALLLNPRPPG